MLQVGYDAQAFLCSNGGTGKGAQLRNLTGPFTDRFVGFASREPELSGMQLVQEGAAGHTLWQQFSLPWSLRRHGIQIFLAPANVAPFFLPRGIELVLVLHDTILMQGFRKPDLQGRLWDRYRRFQIAVSVRRARIVLTVSEHARAEILRLFPRARVQVIPCTLPPKWFAPSGLAGRAGYVLMVTSSAPHKNVPVALKGYARYVELAGASARPLKIVGLARQTAAYLQELERLGIQALVQFLPFLAEEALIRTYQDAGVLLFPSLAEGFGIPMLEAMATGTPVIAARAASLPEVGGKAARYFHPAQPEEMARVLVEVLSDDVLREQMAALGVERARVYAPDVVRKQVIEFWEEVAGDREQDGLRGSKGPAGLGHKGPTDALTG